MTYLILKTHTLIYLDIKAFCFDLNENKYRLLEITVKLLKEISAIIKI